MEEKRRLIRKRAGPLRNNTSRPSFINAGPSNDEFEPVIDVADPSFHARKNSYKVNFDEEYERKEERDATAANLMHKYFPFYIIDEIVNASNKYCMVRKLKEPHLGIWKKYYSAPITHANIYHFISILYYMGIYKLPCKADYWFAHPLMHKHKITTMLGMTRD
eukprot:15351573-Ditylum_brightwellii.AAC.1